MGGIADQFLGAEQRSRRFDRNRCLSKLHTGGVHGEGDVDAIIDEKLSVVSIAELTHFGGEVEKVSAAQILLAQLDRPNSALEGSFQHPEQISPARLASVGYEIEVKIRSGHLRCQLRMPSNGVEAVA